MFILYNFKKHAEELHQLCLKTNEFSDQPRDMMGKLNKAKRAMLESSVYSLQVKTNLNNSSMRCFNIYDS